MQLRISSFYENPEKKFEKSDFFGRKKILENAMLFDLQNSLKNLCLNFQIDDLKTL